MRSHPQCMANKFPHREQTNMVGKQQANNSGKISYKEVRYVGFLPKKKVIYVGQAHTLQHIDNKQAWPSPLQIGIAIILIQT